MRLWDWIEKHPTATFMILWAAGLIVWAMSDPNAVIFDPHGRYP